MSWFQYATSVLFVITLLTTTARAAPLYTLADLGPALGVSVNASGVVAGSILPPDSPQQQAARLQAGSAPQPLGFLVPNGWVSIASGINDSGTIVGLAATDTTGSQARAFFWTPALGMQPLPDLSGTNFQSTANAINSVGTIAGFAIINNLRRPIVWIGNQPSDLGTLGGAEGIANALNDVGDIVGYSSVTESSTAFRATLWPLEGGIMDLQTLPGTFSFANALTSDRRVVGQIGIRGFLWTPAGGMTLLPLLPADISSSARGINEAGIIVGSSERLSTFPGEVAPHATRWVNGVPEDLNTLVEAPGWTLLIATDINETGQIVGFGGLNGAQHTFLLTPSAPASLAVAPYPRSFTTIVHGDFNDDGWMDQAALAGDSTIWLGLAGQGWRQLSGRLASLVGGDLDGNGTDDLAGVSSDSRIWSMTDTQHWTQVPGRLVQVIAADLYADGKMHLAGVAADTSLWQSPALGQWERIPGNLTTLVAGPLTGNSHDDLAGIGHDSMIWAKPFGQDWRQLPGRLVRIGTSLDKLVGMSADNRWWRQGNQLGEWQLVP